MALIQSIHKALEKSVIPVDAVQLIEDTSRETAKELFHLNEYLDVLIPRGGKNLIETVIRESTVPVIETGAGNCHILLMNLLIWKWRLEIVLNAKLQRPSVCNAIETILIHENGLQNMVKNLLKRFKKMKLKFTEMKQFVKCVSKCKIATEEDWYTEYLGLSVSVKVVE